MKSEFYNTVQSISEAMNEEEVKEGVSVSGLVNTYSEEELKSFPKEDLEKMLSSMERSIIKTPSDEEAEDIRSSLDDLRGEGNQFRLAMAQLELHSLKKRIEKVLQETSESTISEEDEFYSMVQLISESINEEATHKDLLDFAKELAFSPEDFMRDMDSDEFYAMDREEQRSLVSDGLSDLMMRIGDDLEDADYYQDHFSELVDAVLDEMVKSKTDEKKSDNSFPTMSSEELMELAIDNFYYYLESSIRLSEELTTYLKDKNPSANNKIKDIHKQLNIIRKEYKALGIM